MLSQGVSFNTDFSNLRDFPIMADAFTRSIIQYWFQQSQGFPYYGWCFHKEYHSILISAMTWTALGTKSLERGFHYLHHVEHVTKYKYNTVQYKMRLNTSLQWLRQSINHGIDPQKTSHIMTSSNGNIFHVNGLLWGESLVDSPQKGQWCGALMFSLICTQTSSWANNQTITDFRCHHAHYDITVMSCPVFSHCLQNCIGASAFAIVSYLMADVGAKLFV